METHEREYILSLLEAEATGRDFQDDKLGNLHCKFNSGGKMGRSAHDLHNGILRTLILIRHRRATKRLKGQNYNPASKVRLDLQVPMCLVGRAANSTYTQLRLTLIDSMR
jgi:hypothetical protein